MKGRLPLWLRIAEGEVKVDHHAVCELSHRTMACGIYLATNHPKPFLDGRPLWIKTRDWTLFRETLVIQRYGADAANSREAALFALWVQETRRDYEQERDRINAEMGMHGRLGSGARIRALTTAALNSALALLRRTQSFPTSSFALPDISAWLNPVMDHLLEDVRRSYQGSRLLGDSGVLDSQALEARERIQAELEKMRLEQALKSGPGIATDSLASTPAPAPVRKRGRTRGSGSFVNIDTPLLAEMKELIANRQAPSPTAAAKLVAARAFGGGTVESKAARLAKAYRALERNGA